MATAHPPASLDSAMELLNYMQAPTVGFYYVGACTFSLCILQKPSAISSKRRRVVLSLMVFTLIAYITEVLYYFSRSLTEWNYEAPKPAATRCLGAILAWSPLVFGIWKSKSLRWHPYFGAFVLQFALETTTCLMSAFSISPDDRSRDIPFVISSARACASLPLMIDGFLILIKKHVGTRTDEERQSLLGKQTNNNANQSGTGNYGSINPDSSSGDGDEEAPSDHDKAIKEQQAKRLEEEGGWLGYLKGFLVFLPYLFPKDDWKVMGALSIRILHMIQERVFNLLTPRQLGIITNKLTEGTNVMPWKDIGLWVLFSYINSYAGTGILDGIASLVISNSAYQRVTLMAYEHVLGLSMDFHTSKDSGEVLKAVEQASSLNTLVELVLFDLSPILLDLVIAMYYVTHLFDSYMAFIILFMGAAYVSIGWYFTTLSQPCRRVYVEKQRTESSTVNETVHNWQTVAYFNRLTFEYNRYATNIIATISAQYSYYFRSMGGHAAQDVLTTVGFAACCIFGMSQIVTKQKSVGNLVTLIMYWHTMTSPLYVLSYSYRQLSASLIDAERLLQLLNTKPTVADQEGAKDLVIDAGKVDFKDVEFAYDVRKPIIKGVSLQADGGQTIAFVGETGGGKSTMLKLLFRFYDVTGGSIMIDGQDLRSVTQSSLRNAIGLVPQDPVLFNQTIRQNIRYARLDATDAEIEEACRAAAIHDDIVGFPDGYNSKVGERGVRLSGGQLQRIAIARVLLKDPKVVMLDEATSAIDSGIEAKIQQAFSKLSKGRTTFVIAHRLSTVVEADQILVVEKGEIIERGTHRELLELGGKYHELWTKQTAGHLPTLPSKPVSKNNPTEGGDNDSATLIDIASIEEDSAKTTGTSEGGSDRVEKRK
ncbi:ATP-binding cassette-type vacuolar membrane transporter-like protein Hmt1 [Dothidotthia symphoricarpi CBS 119687]|uniref:ATP-binding cassette-type vacuolar membrane transporter-like protein Hmt1 n=1 Tax=Dothidotthia symphoricarpi CBS 119687 TaxID=1392245 RepID=A0A6A6A0C1_9PLEO|nr:ATP-binding cassette-type vacuolar membrane transporter-like protein Hmt1 [Dothidotthia symphoricarpi CBS 119687]KAF2124031.1 ATP-binding cassette-type vacuolar membrane transporter-like protein Hmt1 [Dothidotthia symphoricarpi CBS 119687]